MWSNNLFRRPSVQREARIHRLYVLERVPCSPISTQMIRVREYVIDVRSQFAETLPMQPAANSACLDFNREFQARRLIRGTNYSQAGDSVENGSNCRSRLE